MMRRNQRTLEKYMRAGAEMRLYKTLGMKLLMDIGEVVSAQDQDILMRAMHRIDAVCSRAEDNMFHDYPDLSDEYINVFYGDTNHEPRKGIDSQVVEMAREIADELFDREGY